MLTHIFEFFDGKYWKKGMFLAGSHVLWKKYNFSFIYRLCHDFKTSLFFDLLRHFCMNFVDVVMSWASQSLQIARPCLPLGWSGRLGRTENLCLSSLVARVCVSWSLWSSELRLWSTRTHAHTKCARCDLLRSALALSRQSFCNCVEPIFYIKSDTETF